GDDAANAPGGLRAVDRRQPAALTDAPGRRAGIGWGARLRGAADTPLLDRSVAPLRLHGDQHRPARLRCERRLPGTRGRGAAPPPRRGFTSVEQIAAREKRSIR